jgi:hypothetical protein
MSSTTAPIAVELPAAPPAAPPTELSVEQQAELPAVPQVVAVAKSGLSDEDMDSDESDESYESDGNRLPIPGEGVFRVSPPATHHQPTEEIPDQHAQFDEYEESPPRPPQSRSRDRPNPSAAGAPNHHAQFDEYEESPPRPPQSRSRDRSNPFAGEIRNLHARFEENDDDEEDPAFTNSHHHLEVAEGRLIGYIRVGTGIKFICQLGPKRCGQYRLFSSAVNPEWKKEIGEDKKRRLAEKIYIDAGDQSLRRLKHPGSRMAYRGIAGVACETGASMDPSQKRMPRTLIKIAWTDRSSTWETRTDFRILRGKKDADKEIFDAVEHYRDLWDNFRKTEPHWQPDSRGGSATPGYNPSRQQTPRHTPQPPRPRQQTPGYASQTPPEPRSRQRTPGHAPHLLDPRSRRQAPEYSLDPRSRQQTPRYTSQAPSPQRQQAPRQAPQANPNAYARFNHPASRYDSQDFSGHHQQRFPSEPSGLSAHYNFIGSVGRGEYPREGSLTPSY